MSNQINDILKSVDKKKLEELKQKAENGQLKDMLASVDKEKAKQMITEFGLSEQAKKVDLEKLIAQVKQNPEILKKIKKLF